MSWVAAAIGGSAVLGFLGSQNAADAQKSAAGAASGVQWNMYNQSRTDNLPWLRMGGAAANRLALLMGLDTRGLYPDAATAQPAPVPTASGAGGHYEVFTDGEHPRREWVPDTTAPAAVPASAPAQTTEPDPTAQPGFGSLAGRFSMADFQQDPGFAFRLSEGQKALERSGAARGMTLSGAQAKALTAYGQGMGSQEYGNAYNRWQDQNNTLFNRMAALSGVGQTASAQNQQGGMNAANNVSQNMLGAGNASAAGYIGGANAIGNGVNQWVNYNNSNNMWNALNNAGGYGSGMGNPYRFGYQGLAENA